MLNDLFKLPDFIKLPAFPKGIGSFFAFLFDNIVIDTILKGPASVVGHSFSLFLKDPLHNIGHLGLAAAYSIMTLQAVLLIVVIFALPVFLIFIVMRALKAPAGGGQFSGPIDDRRSFIEDEEDRNKPSSPMNRRTRLGG